MAHPPRVSRALCRCLPALLLACGEAPPETPPPDVSIPAGRPPAPMPPPGAALGFAIELPPFQLRPGEERQPCYVFPLDLADPSVVVVAGSVTTGPGLHHGNITTRRKTGDGVRLCDKDNTDHIAFDILGGGAVLFGSSTQVTGTEWQSFPEGMGYRVRQGYEIVARMHYLNPTPAALTVQPRYEWYTVPEARLKTELGPFAWSYSKFQIPPQSDLTVTGDCALQKPMNIVSLLPHMHGLGRRFTAAFLGGPRQGRLFLDADWGARGESDIVQFDGGVDLSQGGLGDGASFSCTWRNTFDKTIREGVGDNEMCILFGYAYPADSAYSALATPQGGCLPVLPPPPK